MSIKSKMDKALLILKNPRVLLEKQNYILILSHMRSRSSLLSHVLGSHDEVCGYGELHYDYPKKSSLLKMHVELLKDTGQSTTKGFFLDKLLHNSFVVSNEILERSNVHILILIREPEATVKSIVKMGEVTGDKGYLDVEAMLKYYTNRLTYLHRIAQEYEGVLIVDSDDIVNSTAETLSEIKNWLGLGAELTSSYKKFKKTGSAGHGDPSLNISAGEIIKTQNDLALEFDPTMLNKAKEIYSKVTGLKAS
ncbi:sulfotransferase family protein [Alteromonas stellipolaris]|uniref:sulfotransferase family protein n=1 Tax=Alteromonas stellipolaris TaxID=233316 RepID=UPI0021176AE4|nr:sulfotransferase family protein [Alteromonas stellipolaris]MCQ8849718.1 sulfotransferase family protein [Alteromonas stellipolaris]